MSVLKQAASKGQNMFIDFLHLSPIKVDNCHDCKPLFSFDWSLW